MQSVLVEGYWLELTEGFAALGHDLALVVLEADPAVVAARIEADSVETTARGWRLRHLDAFADARPWLADAADLVLDTTTLGPAEVADEVRRFVGARLATI